MRISLIDKFTTLTQRIAARSHAAKPLNQARFKRQQGATAIEYAVIAGLIVAVLVIFFASGDGNTFGDIFRNLFSDIKSEISSAK
ncbi:pilus assembly protein Flp/PilA [Chromohalobacter canadensis]|uniref:Pilus assembly protein Flp/PilA n=1 Tax=Chromohalobacter canadensis TaxID=141389 RepID=A0A285VQ66_9GAMM|nr:Flp family type IVb pilin [Chromohalobacter canadensis]SOC56214.1 pilus assembly protein Flp/PilA [Chromohalobacter canadensis]